MKKKKLIEEKCKCNGAKIHIDDTLYRCTFCGKDIKNITGIIAPTYKRKIKRTN
jgi:hypothetical protein